MNADLVPVEGPVDRSPVAAPVPQQAANDGEVLRFWLHGRPARTAREYLREALAFLRFAGQPLPGIILGDVIDYVATRAGYAPATQARTINCLKSLFTFACRIGYCRYNVAATLRQPVIRGTLAERILPESDVQRMLALEPDGRNHCILRLFYASGVRVSELIGLRWKDCQERPDGGQITVLGKGGKTRAVWLPAGTWRELVSLRSGAGLNVPVFLSQRGAGISQPTAWRIVRRAAERAGIPLPVSCHWLRHAHASHALDSGAPISLVQATLGHRSVATTGRYLHAKATESSGKYLAV
ncbi:MAG: tyrosine-type recombinase/integrase [Chloroflexota bacterium]